MVVLNMEEKAKEINDLPLETVLMQIEQIDTRCKHLSKTIDNNFGQAGGLEKLYQSLMDQRDLLVKRKNELEAK